MARMSCSNLFLGLILALTIVGHTSGQKLSFGFYHGKCPNKSVDVEDVIKQVVKEKLKTEPDTVSDLVRLTFHDCFVNGCDGSIFLDGPDTEKTAEPNLSLGGFDTIDDLKTAVEDVCPGVVSCADILVMGARSAVSLTGGIFYEVELGRRDGLVSKRSEALANIPSPDIPITDAIRIFKERNLTVHQFVVLLGGHTVGTAHCHSFKERLYNFKNSGKPDPSLSPELLQLLQETCPLDSTVDNEAFLDQTPNSHFHFDNDYYFQILAHNGTMEIDSVLASSSETRGIVKGLAFIPFKFIFEFGPAMVQMGKIGVLTGNQGQIRKTCGAINSLEDI